ncbi:CSS-motif domain-containing protein [Pseudomonas putida]|uniref:CSS-motif domain-containing protein n=1 Tax=Pseudomonas putida TaxID=303 RepID=UPI002366B1C8|nr:CSS-motif domain-containing protein [Pseudomonas putida]MDD2047613.1 CSS-motif domain-containing protein [Pseudomonas putida]
MVPHSHAGRSLIEFLVTLLIGLAPITCGLLVLVLQVDRKQEETIEVTAREAVYAIDRVVESLHDASHQAIKLLDKPCDAILPDLRMEMVKQPNVRSLALKKDNRIYCSTLYGSTDITLDLGSYVEGRLRVYPSNIATPGSDILLYRLQEGRSAIIAAANLKILQAELLGFQNSVVLSLQFGGQYVWATGNGEYYKVPNHAENTLKLTSQKYGYTVHAGYPDGESWQVIRHAMRAALPSLLLVGIMTSAAGYWGMFRRTKSRSTPAQP